MVREVGTSFGKGAWETLRKELVDEKLMDISELHDLKRKWVERRKRLQQRSKEIGSVGKEANKWHSVKIFGRFCEIEKCTNELTAIINRIQKEINAKVLESIK